MLAAHQYPITFEEIRAGMVRGPERIVTMNSGVYGWPEKRNLHLVYKFDRRGQPVRHEHVTTSDGQSVRTDLQLADGESAIIEPVAAVLNAAHAINTRVLNYTPAALKLLVNGKGAATLQMYVSADDEAEYHCEVNGRAQSLLTGKGTRSVNFMLDGQATIEMAKK